MYGDFSKIADYIIEWLLKYLNHPPAIVWIYNNCNHAKYSYLKESIFWRIQEIEREYSNKSISDISARHRGIWLIFCTNVSETPLYDHWNYVGKEYVESIQSIEYLKLLIGYVLNPKLKIENYSDSEKRYIYCTINIPHRGIHNLLDLTKEQNTIF